MRSLRLLPFKFGDNVKIEGFVAQVHWGCF